MDGKKVATGLTLAVIFVLAIWLGPLIFWCGLIGVIVVVGLLEYASMVPSLSAARKALVFLPACLMPITGACLFGESGLMTGAAAGFLWISILSHTWKSDIAVAMECKHR